MTAPSNANTSGLAPCPFCGGEAWLNDYDAKYSDLPPMSRAPQCRSCGASLGYLTTPAKATEAWNRRVTAASAQARIAELESALAAAQNADAENDAHLRCRATAAEARADRLADIVRRCVTALDASRSGGEYPDFEEWEKDARAALQQETQK